MNSVYSWMGLAYFIHPPDHNAYPSWVDAITWENGNLIDKCPDNTCPQALLLDCPKNTHAQISPSLAHLQCKLNHSKGFLQRNLKKEVTYLKLNLKNYYYFHYLKGEDFLEYVK